MEQGDEEALSIWQWFKDISLVEYKRIYKLLGMDFDHFTGESFYRDKTQDVVDKLNAKNLLVRVREPILFLWMSITWLLV